MVPSLLRNLIWVERDWEGETRILHFDRVATRNHIVFSSTTNTLLIPQRVNPLAFLRIYHTAPPRLGFPGTHWGSCGFSVYLYPCPCPFSDPSRAPGLTFCQVRFGFFMVFGFFLFWFVTVPSTPSLFHFRSICLFFFFSTLISFVYFPAKQNFLVPNWPRETLCLRQAHAYSAITCRLSPSLLRGYHPLIAFGCCVRAGATVPSDPTWDFRLSSDLRILSFVVWCSLGRCCEVLCVFTGPGFWSILFLFRLFSSYDFVAFLQTTLPPPASQTVVPEQILFNDNVIDFLLALSFAELPFGGLSLGWPVVVRLMVNSRGSGSLCFILSFGRERDTNEIRDNPTQLNDECL